MKCRGADYTRAWPQTSYIHLYKFLEMWETLGGLGGEENIESTHSEFSQLMRYFGTTRGLQLKVQVLCQYLFD